LRKTDENFVFFFDNVDTLIKTNMKFLPWIEKLLDDCPNTKVIITCCEATTHPSKYENTVRVEGLLEQKQDAWSIFREIYSKKISDEERK
jgi:hypothetical protein